MRRATIAPIAPFRGVRCILVLHRPYRASALGKLEIGAIYCPACGHVEIRRRLDSRCDRLTAAAWCSGDAGNAARSCLDAPLALLHRPGDLRPRGRANLRADLAA